MKRISVLVLIVLTTSFCWSQSIQLKGKVLSKDDVENIHVINKTQSFFTVTDNLGVFSVEVALNDVLQFTSIQYETLEIKIKQSHISNKYIEITLKPIVNALDTVVLGRILTGDLLSDINNTEGEPDINFYNVGIPGYKGKPKTQSERYLYEATWEEDLYLLIQF